METSVKHQAARPISNPGKLYQYGSYIFINERYKGIHIIQNQDPASPQNIGFIQVPGNVDFAVRGDVLYVDNAVDLVAIDIHDLPQITVTKRIPNTFPALPAPDNWGSEINLKGIPKDAVIVGWEIKRK